MYRVIVGNTIFSFDKYSEAVEYASNNGGILYMRVYGGN